MVALWHRITASSLVTISLHNLTCMLNIRWSVISDFPADIFHVLTACMSSGSQFACIGNGSYAKHVEYFQCCFIHLVCIKMAIPDCIDHSQLSSQNTTLIEKIMGVFHCNVRHGIPSRTWKPGKPGDLNCICPGPEMAWNLSQNVRKPGQNKTFSRKTG